MSFKVGDLVVLTGSRDFSDYKINHKSCKSLHLIGKIFQITGGTDQLFWDYEVERGGESISVKQDQIKHAPIVNTEIYKALVGDYEI